MRQRRLLSYEYIPPKIFFQGCTQCQEFDFLIGPKDTVTPVYQILHETAIMFYFTVSNQSNWIYEKKIKNSAQFLEGIDKL